MALLEVKDLEINFRVYKGKVNAIRGVSFTLEEGETLAIVGESGSGKSVTSKSIMGLLPVSNTEIPNGKIIYKGVDLLAEKKDVFNSIRGSEIAMIFQNPMTSLNPVFKIGKQIMEGMIIHRNMNKHEAKKEALELLDLVGIPNPKVAFNQYPHQLSGGMRQRVVIAIALSCEPKLLIADEPTTALDVTIQAQIIELIKEIQQKRDVAMLFITHDLGVVANVADRVAVMYAGKIVEIGKAEEIFYNPQHPYTWGLMSSIPDMNDLDLDLYSIPGTPPNLLNPPKGDAFAIRSDYALEVDFEEEPVLTRVGNSDTHYAATWLLHDSAPKVVPPEKVVKHREIWKKINGGHE